ncbi:hypothetical protein JCM15519_25550 [Fundidesulfovibrio butyratiphilus]
MSTVDPAGRGRRKGHPFASRWVDAVFAALALAAGVIVFARSPNAVALAWCELAVPFQSVTDNREKLFCCSNVEQEIAYTDADNVALSPADVTGWMTLSPRDPARPARVRVQVIKDRDELLFYPRVGGADSRVSVIQPNGGWPRPLFLLQGREGAWTSISRQYRLCVACLDNSFDRGYRASLEIVLQGRWAQLWTKDGKIFF